mgnify:CR=1 FL=1
MEVILINPPIREHDNPTFPLGLGYLAAVLRKEGHGVIVIDAAAHRLKKDEIINEIKKHKFDVLAIGGLITLFKYINSLTSDVKKLYPNIKIISGGSAASTVPSLFLKRTKVDIGILYEAEMTIIDILKAFKDGTPLKDIPGIAFKDESGNVIVNPLRERIDNLDNLPFPAYDLFPMEIYLKYDLYLGTKNYTNGAKWMKISRTRGCPWRCTFCARNFGNPYKIRSADNVIAEMKMLYSNYGITYFEFQDETFTVHKRSTKEFCDRLIESGHNFKWSCLTRADMVDKELLQKMKDAGCFYINFGLESGSQRMLDAVDKKIKVERMEQAVRWVQEVNIDLAHSFMIGIPGENKETVQETIDFCKRLNLHPNFFICTPYPGTILWDKLKQEGKLQTEEEEETYINGLGESGDAINLNMNVSGLSNEELLNLRDWATKEIANHYYKKHPAEYFKSRIEWGKFAIRSLRNIYTTHGIQSVFTIIGNKLSGKKTKIFTTSS